MLLEFERSCKTAGAGLLTLQEDDSFKLLINYDEVLPAELDEHFRRRITDLRREMESKLTLRQGALQSSLEQVNEATIGMDTDTAESYRAGVDRQFDLWTQWSEEISRLLDAALAKQDVQGLNNIQAIITSGPLLDADV